MSSADEKDRCDLPLMGRQPLYILAPFVPTPQDVVERMLQIADVASRDIVYDLGCGDGRVVITAAKEYGARGVGVDIEPHWVAESQSNAKNVGVEHLVMFHLEDALSVDLSRATVVALYLMHWSTLKLFPIIKSRVKPGTRIVSHNFSMGDWPPAKTEKFTDASGAVHTLYLWIVDDSVQPEGG
jgi:cyclopropane fatty-acyl-phospholipid synthase-like methyltransferase